MRMRVLAAFAAPRSLQDLLLNKTLLSRFSLIRPLPAFSGLPRLDLAATERVQVGGGETQE